MEAEFDEDNQVQLFFEDLVKWDLKKNMKIELAKQEEKEKIMVAENGDNKEEWTGDIGLYIWYKDTIETMNNHVNVLLSSFSCSDIGQRA